ncbi:uncharacterized protein Z520_09838 [Fonsecaea multimorphosa CBS 102226]|uniref:Uncharacterized protein n=1 Tax=Fonsecaea multimorphosa CBS 102226 TaxID=1442371 RepID=A0A0D2JMC8_9EURO|nr:uncharacterized protein Z520_09838 [Fonsecaea multimorphosa CBS 102226]KIX94452.1 hypothetical protein Z520_09838 [Fonsecaea multimorphosa CBS 102226]
MAPSRTHSYGPSLDGGSGSGSNSISRSSTTTTVTSDTTASTAWSDILRQNPQIVSDRYVKKEKLKKHLDATYGEGQCAVHYKSGNFYIIAPDVLSDVSIHKPLTARPARCLFVGFLLV